MEYWICGINTIIFGIYEFRKQNDKKFRENPINHENHDESLKIMKIQ